jgi:hypothetical protein
MLPLELLPLALGDICAVKRHLEPARILVEGSLGHLTLTDEMAGIESIDLFPFETRRIGNILRRVLSIVPVGNSNSNILMV